jgi:C-terminal processing protease CtpA/Prc
MQIVGNKCFVTSVKKGSDAEAKGLKVGDVVSGVADYAPTRENLWKMRYVLYALDPQESLKIAVLNPDNTEREITVKATYKMLDERRREQQQRRLEAAQKPYFCVEISTATIACKLPSFMVDKDTVDKMMKQVRPYRNFIIDLRGNGGGYVSTEAHLTGYFFDRDVKIGDLVTRKKSEARMAKSQKEKIFTGNLMVLIDSNSASASEVFARTIQIEKRGKIVGDISMGAVMTSIFFPMAIQRGTMEFGSIMPYGANITIGDLIMSDGSRLEKVGVVPDYPAKPTGKALLEQFDPVLAYTAGLVGDKLTAQDAGKFYFLTKKPEDDEKLAEEEK